jgi:hypothetical protein
MLRAFKREHARLNELRVEAGRQLQTLDDLRGIPAFRPENFVDYPSYLAMLKMRGVDAADLAAKLQQSCDEGESPPPESATPASPTLSAGEREELGELQTQIAATSTSAPAEQLFQPSSPPANAASLFSSESSEASDLRWLEEAMAFLGSGESAPRPGARQSVLVVAVSATPSQAGPPIP